ncbi:OST-HTH/LOTUS domain-containing protein [Shinella lacus]|uniref:OST-HTH/LOTUS domain-containing protein n=1 Tax=Shinella lacus TaxID=2654216 RepID=UPI00210D3AE1|nr:OST-HTH/LOTUS domain-containing protein [Shinella lacus]
MTIARMGAIMQKNEIIVPEEMKLIPERMGYAPGVKIGGFCFAPARSAERLILKSLSIQRRSLWPHVGSHVAKQSPEFDSRNYAFARLSEIVKATGKFDMDRSGKTQKGVLTHLKPASTATKR